MKRQKRDKNERAYSRGYQAGMKGHSKDFCPYEETQHKDNWLSGWREGWGMHKMGSSSIL